MLHRKMITSKLYAADDNGGGGGTDRDDGGSQQGQQNQSGDGGEFQVGDYTFSTAEEAASVVEALVKRVGERDSSIQNLNERLEQLEAARRKQLEQSGNYEQIAKERAAELEALKGIETRAKTLEQRIRESNERRIEQIPEQMRGLIPTELPPEQVSDYLDRNMAMLTRKPAPDYEGGVGGQGDGQTRRTLDQTQEGIASLMNIDPEEFAQIRDELSKQE